MSKRFKPKIGQESVWDYPRPPRLESFNGHVRIIFNGDIILDTNNALRLLETSHPPTYYLPLSQFRKVEFTKREIRTFCEYKGSAVYFDLSFKGKTASQAAWQYPNAGGTYFNIRNHVAVYAHLMESCLVNNEKVQSQEGDFYGGWITSNIVGPFKGGPNTWGW